MRKAIISTLLAIFSASIFAQHGTIVVAISGIEKNQGTVRIGLYNRKSTFAVYDKVFKGGELNADKNGVTYTFTAIPSGTYALAVWHDEDNDGKIDKNFFGAPAEKYGFSKNCYGILSPPDFDKVSFKIEEEEKISFTINLR